MASRTSGSVGNNPVSLSTYGTGGAKLDRIPSGGLTTEEKFAKRMISSVGHLSFDTSGFSRMLCAHGGYAMQERFLTLAKCIINTYANQHDAGIHTAHTLEAKRLQRSLR